jgi:hypothetical protein
LRKLRDLVAKVENKSRGLVVVAAAGDLMQQATKIFGKSV